MLGDNKKLIKSIVDLRPLEKEAGSKELIGVHSRLMKGRTAFETILAGSMRAAMGMSNLDLQVSDRVEELTDISENFSSTANALSDISAETAALSEGMTAWQTRL